MKAVKKTWLIDPSLVTRAQKACGARTETETVTRALQEMLTQDEIHRAFKRFGSDLADIEVVFPDPVTRRRKK